MPLHLSILQKSKNDLIASSLSKPSGLHKRRRTTSTEISAAEDDDPAVLQDTLDWHQVIVNRNSSLKEQITDALSTRSASFISVDNTELSEEERTSLYYSFTEQAEGFESGFASFDEFMNYSSSSLDDDQAAIMNEKATTNKSKPRIKRKLKKLKRKIKATLTGKVNLQRIRRTVKPILREISNAAAIVCRGVLFLTINVLIVLAVIIMLTI